MAIFNDIEQVGLWLRKNACEGKIFKAPVEGDHKKLLLIAPHVFTGAVPSKDMLVKYGNHPAPSVCVNIPDIKAGENIRFLIQFCIYDPGDAAIIVPANAKKYRIDPNENRRDLDGWKQLLLWLEETAEKLRKTFEIGEKRVLPDIAFWLEKGKDKDDIACFYPYFMGYLEFSLEVAKQDQTGDLL